MLFQSTPPVKAATPAQVALENDFFISIHAAREGGDVGAPPHCKLFAGFQSTPPVKAATGIYFSAMPAARYFNPRRP